MPGLKSARMTSPRRRSAHPKKHPEFYLPQGNIVIRVENTLFRVELSVLQSKSTVFATIVPPASIAQTIFNDAHPFELLEDRAEDFERLLWMMYTTNSPLYRATKPEEWLSILRMSDKYGIDPVRHTAIQQLHLLPIDPIQKIVIWDTYRLDPTQLTSSWVELCKRAEPLSLDMTTAIGLRNFTKLAAARDMFLSQRSVVCKQCGGGKMRAREVQALAEKCVAKKFAQPSPSLASSRASRSSINTNGEV